MYMLELFRECGMLDFILLMKTLSYLPYRGQNGSRSMQEQLMGQIILV